MKKKNTKRILLTVAIIGISTVSFSVSAYDNKVIHPQMSKASIGVYEQSKAKQLTKQQRDWIVEGTIAEDTLPRFRNHFYNPQTGEGLNDGGFSGISAKEWLMDQSSVSGDYSVSKILENYKNGNKKRAYQGVGHALHLIQDMANPAHTRNDSHVEGGAYEIWAHKDRAFGNKYSPLQFMLRSKYYKDNLLQECKDGRTYT